MMRKYEDSLKAGEENAQWSLIFAAERATTPPFFCVLAGFARQNTKNNTGDAFFCEDPSPPGP